MEGGLARGWDLMSGQQVPVFKAGWKIHLAALSHNAGYFAFITDKQRLVIIDGKKGEAVVDREMISEFVALGFTGSGKLLSLSKNGRLFSTGITGETVLLYNTAMQVKQAEIMNDGIAIVQEDNQAFYIQQDTEKKGFVPLKIEPVAKNVEKIAYDPDANKIYYQTGKQTLVAWDIKKKAKAGAIHLNQGEIHIFKADGNQAIIVNTKNEIWLCKDGQEKKIATLPIQPQTILLDGQYLMIGLDSGIIDLWAVRSSKKVASLISTKTGWAIVGSDGSFSGSEDSLTDVIWQDPENGHHAIPVGNLSANHYQPELLTKIWGNDSQKPSSSEHVVLTLPPTLAISVDTDSSKVTVRGEENRGGGIVDIKLYQNGKRVSEKLLIDSKKNIEKLGREELTKVYSLTSLEKVKKLTAVGVNNDLTESSPTEYILKRNEKRGVSSGRVNVVAIGIDVYDDKRLELVSAVADAESFKDIFKEGQAGRRVPATLTTLVNSEVTKESVFSTLESLKSASLGDTVLIYLTGHGITVDGTWYYLPSNITLDNFYDQVEEKGITADDIQNVLTDIPADQIFLAIDSCQAGGIMPEIKKFAGLHALRTLSRNSGIHILAATDRNQNALEVDILGHGLLTFSILEGVKSMKADLPPKDGNVSVRELIQYSSQIAPLLSRQFGGYKQYPTAFSRGSDFVVYP